MATEYIFEPYGNTTISGSADTNSQRYTGREDDGAGLYHYRARYYIATLGRFLSEDPIGIAGGINGYLYADNNPLAFLDPLGLAPGDKDFGIKDRGFWDWWHREQKKGGAWWGSDEPGFNPKKPNDIPNQRCAEALYDDYKEQTKNVHKGRSGAPRPKGWFRGGGRGSD